MKASVSVQSRLPLASPSPEPIADLGANAAGFVSRSIAMVIDLAFITALMLGAASVGQLVGLLLPKFIWLTSAVPVAVGALISVLPLAYFFLTVAVTGRTLGKAVMGLRIIRPDGRRLSVVRSFVRAVAYLVSLVPVGAGFLWILVDRDRRGWHDHIAGSRVVFDPRVEVA
jgi:uncharacterized RDD family membrane protein YckC